MSCTSNSVWNLWWPLKVSNNLLHDYLLHMSSLHTFYYSLSMLSIFFKTSTEVTKYFASNIIIWITKENFKPMAVLILLYKL